MSKRRPHISLKVRLAATLLLIVDKDGNRVVSHDDAKLMSAEQIISLYEFHHSPIPKAEPFNGPDEPWNLEPRLIAEHSRITNKDNGTGRSDRKVIAKVRNTIKKANERAERIEAEQVGDPVRERGFKRRWPSREIPSRPFQKRVKNKQKSIGERAV